MSVSNLLLIDVKNNDVVVSFCKKEGAVLMQETRSFDSKVSSDFGRYADANEFLYATRSAINSLILQFPKTMTIDCIGIVGNMNSFLFCDKQSGMVLTPTFFLEDDRALDVYQSVKKTAFKHDYESITNQIFSRYSLFTHLKWFLEKKDQFFSFSFQQSNCMSLELYLLFNLTGLNAFEQDYMSAFSSGIVDFVDRDFSSIILEDLNLSRTCFPELVSPFSIKHKSKGFIPLRDDIPISFITHTSIQNWLFDSTIDYGSLNINLTHNSITLEQHIGYETGANDALISKTFVEKRNDSFYCLKDVIPIPHFSKKLLPGNFSNLITKQISRDNHNSWIVLNPDHSDINQEFALINHNVNSLDYGFETALLEGLFYLVRLKLSHFETISNMRPHTFYCTSILSVHDSVWQLCADILQHPLNIVDMEHTYYGFLNELNGKSSFSQSSGKKNLIRTIVPTQDPITSYSRYQSWLNYYQKIFKN
jgi:sugar (pentulose or hexulose) kinase